jgi:hypothetical protein
LPGDLFAMGRGAAAQLRALGTSVGRRTEKFSIQRLLLLGLQVGRGGLTSGDTTSRNGGAQRRTRT